MKKLFKITPKWPRTILGLLTLGLLTWLRKLPQKALDLIFDNLLAKWDQSWNQVGELNKQMGSSYPDLLVLPTLLTLLISIIWIIRLKQNSPYRIHFYVKWKVNFKKRTIQEYSCCKCCFFPKSLCQHGHDKFLLYCPKTNKNYPLRDFEGNKITHREALKEVYLKEFGIEK